MSPARPLAVSIAVAALVSGCGRTEGPSPPAPVRPASSFDLAAARKTIEANNVRFTKAHVTGDVAAVDALFTHDARSLPPGAEPVVGLPAIHVLTEEYLKAGISEFTETTMAFDGDENLLVDQGDYTVVYGKEHTVEKGKYLNVWKKDQGAWKISVNIWNTNTAPSTGPAS